MWGKNPGAENKVSDTADQFISYEVVTHGQHLNDELLCSCIFTNLNSINS